MTLVTTDGKIYQHWHNAPSEKDGYISKYRQQWRTIEISTHYGGVVKQCDHFNEFYDSTYNKVNSLSSNVYWRHLYKWNEYNQKVIWIFKGLKMNIISTNSYGIKFEYSVSLSAYSVVSVV